MKKALLKYECKNVDCSREFVTKESSREIEANMICPFCECEVEAVVGGDEDAQDLYEEMGCLYPGGGK